MASVGANVSERSPSQEQISNELLRQSIMGQTQLTDSYETPTAPSWMAPSNMSAAGHPRPSANQWEREPLNRMTFGSYQFPSQAMSSMPAPSWANDAFIASSFASGAGQYPPGLGPHRKTATQLGAIGQTPPCGQGG